MTMREMSARSGVSEATLRMWELRHGFPDAAAALERAPSLLGARPGSRTSGPPRPGERPVAAGRDRLTPRTRRRSSRRRSTRRCGRAFPELEPQLLPKRAMLVMSRAIEDECPGAGRAAGAVRLLSARALLPASEAALARARAHGGARRRAGRFPARAPAAARADRGADSRQRSARPRVGDRVRVAEFRGLPDGLGATARGTGTSASSRRYGRSRRHAVRLAAQVCWRLASQAAPEPLADLRERLHDAPVAREHELRSAIQLSTRMVRYAAS